MLFKADETPPPTTEDRGLSLKRQDNPITSFNVIKAYPLLAYFEKKPKPSYSCFQAWIKIAEGINSPAPLPEDQEFPLLKKMLFPATYEVLEKTAKKAAKGAKKGPHQKGAADMMSEDETSSSSAADDDEEEEERDSPPEVGRKKRAASTNPEAGAPKRVRGSHADNSVWDVDSSPKRPRRTKPEAAS